MPQFRVRWPASDGDGWSSIEATDARDAAERYAASVCSDDNACYDDFERGQDVEVRFPGSPDILPYRVSCEFSPTFNATRRAALPPLALTEDRTPEQLAADGDD